MSQRLRAFGLILALVIIVAAIWQLSQGKARPVASGEPAKDVVVTMPADAMRAAQGRIASKSLVYEKAKEIMSPAGFVNTGGKPIQLADYVGKKVILLDIMTYSCINCIRTFPYIVDWHKKYEDKGLVIIGIHTPEFDFEKIQSNVEAAMKKYGITFPVVLDNDYGTWTAYKNLYWPRKYLIDIDGFIRYDHIGEGGYAETEKKIQELLRERSEALGLDVSVNMPVTSGVVEKGSFNQSHETYLGAGRNEYLANGPHATIGVQSFVLPAKLKTSSLYLDGLWDVEPEHSESQNASSAIVYPFSAGKVFLVMSADQAQGVEILIDGKPVAAAEKGEDVVIGSDGKSTVMVSESRLYSLYAGPAGSAHTITIRASAKGLRAFAFTFGS